jgi:hypothetical protein
MAAHDVGRAQRMVPRGDHQPRAERQPQHAGPFGVEPVEIALDVVQHAADITVLDQRALVPLGREQHLAQRPRQRLRPFDPAPRPLIGEIEMEPAKIARARRAGEVRFVSAGRAPAALEIERPDDRRPGQHARFSRRDSAWRTA